MAKIDYSSNEYLAKLAKEGNKDAYEELLVKNERLCYHFAQKFSNIDNVEDLASIGKIGLLKAYENFDITRNIKFATFASRCIHNEILMHYRKIRKHKRNISIDNPISVDFDGNDLTLMDVLSSPENDYLKFENEEGLSDVLNKTLKKLNSRDKIVFQKFFFDRINQNDIGMELNLSQSYISRLITKFSKLLQKVALENNFISEGDLKMTKINTNHFAFVNKNYPELSIRDLTNVFSVSAATINNYKKRIKDMEDDIVEPSKVIMNKIKTILEEKENKSRKKINKVMEHKEAEIKKEIVEIKKEIKNVVKISREIISSNNLNIKGKDAIVFLRNYANVIEDLENVEIELSLKLDIYKKEI